MSIYTRVIRPKIYIFPLIEFNDRIFRIEAKKRGINIISVARDYKNKVMRIAVDRELTKDEVKWIERYIKNPKKGHIYRFIYHEEEEVKKVVESIVGIKPLYVILDGEGRIREIAFERKLNEVEEKLLEKLRDRKFIGFRYIGEM